METNPCSNVPTSYGKPSQKSGGTQKVILICFRNPQEQKYRCIHLDDPTFSNRLLPFRGAVECLFEMGFEEKDSDLILPVNISLDTLRLVRDQIKAEQTRRMPSRPSVSDSTQVAKTAKNPSQMPVTSQLMICGLPDSKERASELADLLLIGLQRWYKGWFRWVDTLPCERCSGRTTNAGSLTPSSEDRMWLAGRVENHHCQACNHSTRFPRYNHPGRLLETHRGRCGEWANCFTFLCRVAGYEARYILDVTDHVWTEVYSQAQKRWLHCDPGEGCDKPLLYEVGWGKKLSYVIAFSKEEVVDVSWRYSFRHADMAARRTRCREPWLRRTITRLNQERQQKLSKERILELQQRFVVELVEFISPREPQRGEFAGRKTGSLAWRIMRGELGSTSKILFIPRAVCVLFHLHYDTASDTYERVSDGSTQVHNWEVCTDKAAGVTRHTEHDWKMAYIARIEGCANGLISWKFDFAPVGLKVEDLSIRVGSTVFENGQVTWNLSSETTTVKIEAGEVLHVLPELKGASRLILQVELTGGKDTVAWQHAQIFRQSLNAQPDKSPPFEIIVKLEQCLLEGQ
uniref:Peptide-N(4)-(N-acetyl-beta-glucosaminyl)asparagine amidase n=1 Tax=Eptatretus burgeri TaxID=7764 RepID=A0A8C4QB46_EPTBU